MFMTPLSREAEAFATPGELAMALDPTIVQTPAFDLIDSYLIQVRDAVATMYRRRALYSRLVREGTDHSDAAEIVADEVPQQGITRLQIAMPPQEGKSTRVSRHFPVWLLQQFPRLRIAIVSYDGANATQFSFHSRADVERFNGNEGEIDLGLRLATDEKAKSRWLLATGGGLYAIGIGGGLTGRPVDLMIVDDPVKDQRDADSALMSVNKWTWWQTVGRPRLAPWAPVIGMATRWAEDDLLGRWQAAQKHDEALGSANTERWTVLTIPAEADHDPGKGEVDPLGREPGEFLVSARGRTRDDWLAIKEGTSTRFWNALYQGRPSAVEGDVLKRGWWRRYDSALWVSQIDGSYLVPGYEVWQSWDLTFTDSAKSDYVVGQVWATKKADSYLVYQVRARLNFPSSVDAVRRVSRLFPQARRKLVEKAANGHAAIDVLRREIPGIIPVKPDRSKEARADAVSTFLRSGNIFLPTVEVATANPELAFDVEDVIEEAAVFPRGVHDDQVDAFTQFARERYLLTSPARVLSPNGRVPDVTVAKAARSVSRLSPVQQRLARGRG